MLRKIYVIIIIMCLVKHVTHSQTKSTVGNAQWNVGLNGTVNLNQFNFSGLVTGGEINGFIARVLNDNFSLQAELGVKQLGGNRRDAAQEFEGGNVDQILYFNRRAVINSFNSNLILNIHPRTELGSVSMTLFFGVSHALKVEVSEVQDQFYFFNDGSSIYVSEVRQNTSRFYENSIFSGLMGLSVAVPFGKKTMDFQMRYEQGINQLNRVKFSIPQYAGKLRTNSLKIGLSYQLFNF